MALSVLITRTDLATPLAALELNSGNYRWSSADSETPGVIWDKKRADSPYVDGELLVSAKKGLVLQPARIIVMGANNSALRENIEALVVAFGQFTYEITIDPDDSDVNIQSWTWQCEPADYRTGQYRLEKAGLITDFTLSIPRMPDPTGSDF